MMPLKLIECVLPWLVGSLNETEVRSFLQNMHMAGEVLIHHKNTSHYQLTEVFFFFFNLCR